MTGNVRFLKQREAGDAPAGKLVPPRRSDGMKAHFLDEPVEDGAEGFGVRDRCLVAMMSFDDPLAAGCHSGAFIDGDGRSGNGPTPGQVAQAPDLRLLRLSGSTFRTELGNAGDRLAAVEAELRLGARHRSGSGRRRARRRRRRRGRCSRSLAGTQSIRHDVRHRQARAQPDA
jgi:hypothetical protein